LANCLQSSDGRQQHWCDFHGFVEVELPVSAFQQYADTSAHRMLQLWANGSGCIKAFRSREASTDNANSDPQLLVEYE
jgi:hypothetical protein